MSVVQEWDCKLFNAFPEEKLVNCMGIDGAQYNFKYDIHCQADVDTYGITFYFNIKESKMLITVKRYSLMNPTRMTSCSCAIMKYWVNSNDRPVGSSEWIYNQDEILRGVKDSFREQLAAITFDKVIND